MKKVYKIKNLNEFNTAVGSIAKELLLSVTSLETATIITLSGNLGAGKTTFTQELGRILKIKEPINSPTFVIEKRYKIKHTQLNQLIHIDAYRLEGENPGPLNFEETFSNPQNLVVIEWPDKITQVLKNFPHTSITISHNPETDSRELKIV